MKGLVAINGEITTVDQAKVPILDRGLLFGDDVFEVFVAVGGYVFDMAKHLTRLRRSAALIDLEVPWQDEVLAFEINSLVQQLAEPKTYVRLMVTRGEGTSVKGINTLTPNRYTICLPASKEPESSYTEGIKIKTVQSPFSNRVSVAKTGNYLPSIVNLGRAMKENFDEILWISTDHEVMEASTANIFFIGRDGDLVEIATPPTGAGILDGITRSTIKNLLNSSKIPVTERSIFTEELPRFDECFICSTVRGLIPVGRIDGHKFHTLRKNSVYQHIERLFLSWVESQLGYRVEWNTGRRL
jgi:branched-subunit amino acid aminotransferase/4-amino-4-deoxychorismate lyase